MRIKSLVERFLKIRIIRYGLVGGIGIPIQDLALFAFSHLMGDALFPLALACSFEVSNIINFILNQVFTYREQVQGIHGWEWVRRCAKGQLTSLSALLISYVTTMILYYVFHVDEYLASPIGIVVAFFYNFFISNKLVFRPTAPAATPLVTEKEAEAIPVEVESTSK
ncbi:MAG TPA: GtrA family protein [Ktedonobacteraceae bacterium]|nr:GtrA family protein [Ktedonobacteraceae bacterium]